MLPSWRLHLEAANLPPRTIRAYTDDGALFAAFLADKGMPTVAGNIRCEHVEAFIAAERRANEKGEATETKDINKRIAAEISWSRAVDQSARTWPARRAFLGRFEREVDPDGTLPPTRGTPPPRPPRPPCLHAPPRQEGGSRPQGPLSEALRPTARCTRANDIHCRHGTALSLDPPYKWGLCRVY